MSLLDKLEKRFGHLAVPNVIFVLVIAQVFLCGMILIGRVDFFSLLLIPKAVLHGEWWRLLSFFIAPPTVPTSVLSAVFLAFSWYILWMMSGALESVWSVFRFNLYLLSGILFTVSGAFIGQMISPSTLIISTPYFLYLSIFFAFATTHPNMEFLMFFVVPVKVKWMALLLGVITFGSFLFAPSMGDRIAIIAPILNYLLFFRSSLLDSLKGRQRRAKFESNRRATNDSALHTCELCGETDQSDPQKEFRYRMVDGEAQCVCDACREASSD